MLAINGDFKCLESHISRRLQRGPEGEAHRVSRVVLYEATHGSFHGCGKAHRLALLRQGRHDSAYCWKKSHIQHAIRLIKHQNLQAPEMDMFPIEEIFQPARSRDDHPSSVADGAKLVPFGQSADHQCGGRESASQGVELIGDLHGELARGNENKGCYSFRILTKKLFNHRD